MEAVRQWFQQFRAVDVHLFKIGNVDVTLWSVLQILVSLIVLFWFAGWLRRWTASRLLPHAHLDPGSREMVASLLRYVVLVAGMMVILQTAGINLTAFNVLAGAVGVGVGFGLQDIVKNFISGLIIMFDRTVKIGDRISITGIEGDVVDVGARRSTLMTPMGVTVIVPNSKFMTENVINVQRQEGLGSLKLSVAVSHASDPRLAERLLYEIAAGHPQIARQPAPFVRLNMPTAGSFPFDVEMWTSSSGRERDKLLNQLHYELHAKLLANDVQLA